MADRRVCFPCSVGTSHTCPICLEVIAGSGQAPCYACSQRRRSERQIAEEAAGIPHSWLADLFTAFCQSGAIPLDTGIANGWIARASEACRRIALTVSNPGGLTTDSLHAALGADDLRRVAPLIAYMTQTGVLRWDRARLKTLIEGDRVEAILEAHRDGPHASVLRAYRNHLASRDRKPITQRTALNAALALLGTLGDAPIADLGQRHLTATLRRSPGHRAALQGFLGFLAAHGGPRLTLTQPRPDPVVQERRLRADIRTWRKRLRDPRTSAEARALVAVLITRIYALPLNSVLTLRRDEARRVGSSVVLWPDADAVVIEQPLAGDFLRWTTSNPQCGLGGTWVFPGRHGHQPLSEAAVAYHLSAKGKNGSEAS
ncbi:hypothetical protein ADL19_10000 [Streptomyces purpurogeneiscleroticus]|nr:hypothetical protein ADL19_10000 [Streptomyces purpurogeneiscleroticus]